MAILLGANARAAEPGGEFEVVFQAPGDISVPMEDFKTSPYGHLKWEDKPRRLVIQTLSSTEVAQIKKALIPFARGKEEPWWDRNKSRYSCMQWLFVPQGNKKYPVGIRFVAAPMSYQGVLKINGQITEVDLFAKISDEQELSELNKKREIEGVIFNFLKFNFLWFNPFEHSKLFNPRFRAEQNDLNLLLNRTLLNLHGEAVRLISKRQNCSMLEAKCRIHGGQVKFSWINSNNSMTVATQSIGTLPLLIEDMCPGRALGFPDGGFNKRGGNDGGTYWDWKYGIWNNNSLKEALQ